jgi:predicted nicotinamide N-methyase
MSDLLATGEFADVKDRTVLELGAGTGLPSLVCALKGARSVRTSLITR